MQVAVSSDSGSELYTFKTHTCRLQPAALRNSKISNERANSLHSGLAFVISIFGKGQGLKALARFPSKDHLSFQSSRSLSEIKVFSM